MMRLCMLFQCSFGKNRVIVNFAWHDKHWHFNYTVMWWISAVCDSFCCKIVQCVQISLSHTSWTIYVQIICESRIKWIFFTYFVKIVYLKPMSHSLFILYAHSDVIWIKRIVDTIVFACFIVSALECGHALDLEWPFSCWGKSYTSYRDQNHSTDWWEWVKIKSTSEINRPLKAPLILC